LRERNSYFKGQQEKKKLEERLPMCLLHEGVARIVEVGEGVEMEKETEVVVNPMLPCGECVACKAGIGEKFCQNSKYMAATADGLAGTLFIYPQEGVIPIPAGVELEIAALTEPLSIALNALEEAQIREKERVAVIGDGVIGYLVALVVSFVGGIPEENLYLFGIIDEKLSLANDFAVAVNSIRERREVKTAHQNFDIVFEAVGGKAQKVALEEAFDLLKPAGKAIVLGLPPGKKLPINTNKLVNKGLMLQGSAKSRLKHYRMIIESN